MPLFFNDTFTGAHYRDNQAFSSDIRNFLATLQSLNFKGPILYRFTSPGHVHCNEPSHSLHPYNSLSQFNFQFNSSTFDYKKSWNWPHFEEQNAIAKEILLSTLKIRQKEEGGVRFLEIVNMTKTRVDGHVGGKDCLHYNPSYPSVVTRWNWVLYNVLMDIYA